MLYPIAAASHRSTGTPSQLHPIAAPPSLHCTPSQLYPIAALAPHRFIAAASYRSTAITALAPHRSCIPSQLHPIAAP